MQITSDLCVPLCHGLPQVNVCALLLLLLPPLLLLLLPPPPLLLPPLLLLLQTLVARQWCVPTRLSVGTGTRVCLSFSSRWVLFHVT
jgi:hypothetical protein